MEEKKNILLHLYGEESAEGDLRSSLTNESLKAEHQALSEVKFRLDHLSRSRPDASAVDRIMSHASEAAAATKVGGRRGDRAPLWRARPLRRVLIPAVSLAAAIVLAVGLGMFSTESSTVFTAQEQFVAERASVEAESLLGAKPVIPDPLVSNIAKSADPLLEWDYAETLRELSRRIDTMNPTDDLDWGARSIPLETLPGASQPGVQQASSRRQ